MVKIENYLQKTNYSGENQRLPMLNSLFIERFSVFNPYSQDNNFKTFMSWARKSPQLMGFLNIIATDMLSDSIDFKPIDRSSGRNKVIKAKSFWTGNKGLEIAEETIYDLLITGIGYNWMGLISPEQFKEVLTSALADTYPGIEKKELEFKADRLVDKLMEDKLGGIPKSLRHVASTTMTMHTDEYKVIKYLQRVGTNYKEFDPQNMLVFKLMPLDGKVYPFPPMECILAEVYLMWLITQNYVSYFENGGAPDNVFILPKELAGSKNHEYLIETLKKYKKVQNRHGQLVFTGDLTIEKMMEADTQMQNKDLGLYLVGVLAMMYGIPVSRIPFLVGKSATGGDSGGLADSGYWRKISVWQSKLEETYNRDLFIPYFGVEMKFGRGYLQDEVRETQTAMQKTSIAEQRMRLGLWTVEAAGEFLGIEEEEILRAQEQKKEREEEQMENDMKSGMMNQNMEKDSKVKPEPDNQLKRKVKQDTQKKNQTNAGGKKVNP